eukprot:gene20726-gene21001
MAVDDPGEDVRQIGLRVHIVQLARLNEAGDDRPVLGAAVTTGEQTILPRQADGPDRSLNDVGVDLDTAVFQEVGKPVPVLERVGDGLTHVRPGHDLAADLDQPAMEVA